MKILGGSGVVVLRYLTSAASSVVVSGVAATKIVNYESYQLIAENFAAVSLLE